VTGACNKEETVDTELAGDGKGTTYNKKTFVNNNLYNYVQENHIYSAILQVSQH